MTSLGEHYTALESGYLLEEDPSFADLVVPNGNSTQPFHRWFHLKEAFSEALTSRILTDLGAVALRSQRILDPFAGVGTSVICGMLDRRVSASYGIERNPFLSF